MRTRRNLAMAGVLLTLLFMGFSAMRVQGLQLRARRAGMETAGALCWHEEGLRLAGAGELGRIVRHARPEGVLCLIARGRGADARNVVRLALDGVGQTLQPGLAEGMDGGVQAAARADETGVILYLADPYIPMDY